MIHYESDLRLKISLLLLKVASCSGLKRSFLLKFLGSLQCPGVDHCLAAGALEKVHGEPN